MPGSATETNVEEIARALAKRRDQGKHAVLFLGARAGGLFGNEYLYETLKKFSLLNFDTLSNVDKFRECYYILSKHFTESETHNILVGALAAIRYREEDKLLAELVKAGFFEAIISTNIDTLLEDACSSWGMWETDVYRVFIPSIDDITEIEQNKPRYGSLIKVFGDLDSLHYNTAGSKFDLQAAPTLQTFLESKLTGDVLIIGYDPVWDGTIEQVFPARGGTVWYVNETALVQDTHLADVLNRRDSKILWEDRGSYSSFLPALYDYLGQEVSWEEAAAIPFPLHFQSPGQARKGVFISYSQKDKDYLERLRVHLMGYLYAESEKNIKDILDIWDDTKISPDTDRKKEVKKALMHVKVAVLLVSKNFLSSARIRKYELPILLETAQRGDLKLLPIILDVSASSFNDRDPLNQYQIVNSVSEPLKWMKPYEQEVVWAKLAEQVYDILRSQ